MPTLQHNNLRHNNLEPIKHQNLELARILPRARGADH